MALQFETYTLPAFWASYLVNGDASGLDNDELHHVNAWMRDSGVKSSCFGCSDQEEFRRTHDASKHVNATLCLDYYFPAA